MARSHLGKFFVGTALLVVMAGFISGVPFSERLSDRGKRLRDKTNLTSLGKIVQEMGRTKGRPKSWSEVEAFCREEGNIELFREFSTEVSTGKKFKVVDSHEGVSVGILICGSQRDREGHVLALSDGGDILLVPPP